MEINQDVTNVTPSNHDTTDVVINDEDIGGAATSVSTNDNPETETSNDELITKFQSLMKSKMKKKTFDLRKHAERISREDNLLKQRNGIFSFFKNRSISILTTYLDNPEDESIIVRPWKLFNKETYTRREIGNCFEIFKWTLNFKRTKEVPFDIANYFRNRERREQMLAGLTQTLREESGYDVEFRIFCNTKKGRSKDEKINYKKCTFHLNLHVPYDE